MEEVDRKVRQHYGLIEADEEDAAVDVAANAAKKVSEKTRKESADASAPEVLPGTAAMAGSEEDAK
ncbi:MAG: hypothetical protein LUG56_08110, partial [Lachnospiraceae bacterium]|nr:hypothetical protein [Lachnospiraceae bacterium]